MRGLLPIIPVVLLLSGCNSTVNDRLSRAEDCYEAGDYDVASAECENVLRDAPYNSEGIDLLKKIYQKRGKMHSGNRRPLHVGSPLLPMPVENNVITGLRNEWMINPAGIPVRGSSSDLTMEDDTWLMEDGVLDRMAAGSNRQSEFRSRFRTFDDIVFKEIKVEEMSCAAFISHMEQLANKSDPKKRRIRIMCDDTLKHKQTGTISIECDELSFTTLLGFLCNSWKLDAQVDGNTISLRERKSD